MNTEQAGKGHKRVSPNLCRNLCRQEAKNCRAGITGKVATKVRFGWLKISKLQTVMQTSTSISIAPFRRTPRRFSERGQPCPRVSATRGKLADKAVRAPSVAALSRCAVSRDLESTLTRVQRLPAVCLLRRMLRTPLPRSENHRGPRRNAGIVIPRPLKAGFGSTRTL